MRRFLCSLAAAALVLVPAAPALAAGPADREGNPLPPRVGFQLSAAGISGTTTLDAQIQRVADAALDDGMTEARSAGLFPTGGAVVVLDLERRALAALASSPEPERIRGAAAVAAGSVVKPVVAAAALAHGLDPSEPLPCPARFTASESTIRNWKRVDQKPMPISEALSQSCNTVFASIAARLWNMSPSARPAIRNAFINFGFGFPSGLVPGEAPGWVPQQPVSLGDLMVLSIGQGALTVTPLQVAVAFAAIARPSAKPWLDISGREVRAPVAPALGEKAAPIRDGLERAVREGTARSSFEAIDLDRFPIAGKTGSAEIGDATPYAWFASYAPADHPRYVVTVMVERGRAGALSAAPIARRILDGIFDLPHRPPPLPVPHPAALLLVLPIVAGLASAPAGAIAGFAGGIAAAAIGGGSVAANVLAFSGAGWLAARGRNVWLAAVAAGLGTLALKALERPVWWIAARAATAAVLAGISWYVVRGVAMAMKKKVATK